MKHDKEPRNLLNDYVYGLLPEDEVRELEEKIVKNPEWASVVDRLKKEKSLLERAFEAGSGGVSNDELRNVKNAFQREWGAAPAPKVSKMNLIGGLLTLAAAAILLFTLVNLNPAKTQNGDHGSLSVLSASGELFIKADGDWKPFQKGDAVPNGATLKTGKGAKAKLLLPDGSSFWQNENSIVLCDLDADDGHLNLEDGELCFESGKNARGREWILKTPQIGVKLADAVVNLKARFGLSEISVEEGSASLSNLRGSTRLDEGWRGLCAAEREPSKPRKFELGTSSRWTKEWVAEARHSVEKETVITRGLQSGFGELSVKLVPGLVSENPIRLSEHRVRVDIEDGVARTHIEEVFFNDSYERLEGTFLFPLPPDASVNRFAMYTTPDQLVEGEVVERIEGRKIYQDIVNSMRDPALLEWMQGSTFKARVFPIEPRNQKVVILSYTQVLNQKNGSYEYVLPLVSDNFEKNPPEIFSLECNNLSALPFLESGSPSHNIHEKAEGNSRAFTLEAENYRPQNDFVYQWRIKARDGAIIRTQGGLDSEAGYFMARVCPEFLADAGKTEAADYLFLADASRSVGPRDFLMQFKFVETFLAKLKPEDRFNIGAYNLGLNYFDEKFLSVDDLSRTQASYFLWNCENDGGTDLNSVLEAALTRVAESKGEHRPCHVFLLGDGMGTFGVQDSESILNNMKDLAGTPNLRLHTVEIGSSVDHAFMRNLAAQFKGLNLTLGSGSVITGQVEQALADFNTPVLSDIHVAPESGFEGAVEDIYPTEFPLTLSGQDIFLTGRALKPDFTLRLDYTFNGQKKSVILDSTQSMPAAYVSRLWAKTAIDGLQDKALERNRVINLSVRHQVISRFTVFLVLENESEYQKHGIVRAKRADYWKWVNVQNREAGKKRSDDDESFLFFRNTTRLQLREGWERGEGADTILFGNLSGRIGQSGNMPSEDFPVMIVGGGAEADPKSRTYEDNSIAFEGENAGDGDGDYNGFMEMSELPQKLEELSSSIFHLSDLDRDKMEEQEKRYSEPETPLPVYRLKDAETQAFKSSMFTVARQEALPLHFLIPVLDEGETLKLNDLFEKREELRPDLWKKVPSSKELEMIFADKAPTARMAYMRILSNVKEGRLQTLKSDFESLLKLKEPEAADAVLGYYLLNLLRDHVAAETCFFGIFEKWQDNPWLNVLGADINMTHFAYGKTWSHYMKALEGFCAKPEGALEALDCLKKIENLSITMNREKDYATLLTSLMEKETSAAFFQRALALEKEAASSDEMNKCFEKAAENKALRPFVLVKWRKHMISAGKFGQALEQTKELLSNAFRADLYLDKMMLMDEVNPSNANGNLQLEDVLKNPTEDKFIVLLEYAKTTRQNAETFDVFEKKFREIFPESEYRLSAEIVKVNGDAGLSDEEKESRIKSLVEGITSPVLKARGLLYLISLHASTGDWDGAKSYCGVLAELKGKDPQIGNSVSTALHLFEGASSALRYREAREMFSGIQDVEEVLLRSDRNMLSSLVAKGKCEDALSLWNEFLKKDTDSFVKHLGIALDLLNLSPESLEFQDKCALLLINVQENPSGQNAQLLTLSFGNEKYSSHQRKISEAVETFLREGAKDPRMLQVSLLFARNESLSLSNEILAKCFDYDSALLDLYAPQLDGILAKMNMNQPGAEEFSAKWREYKKDGLGKMKEQACGAGFLIREWLKHAGACHMIGKKEWCKSSLTSARDFCAGNPAWLKMVMKAGEQAGENEFALGIMEDLLVLEKSTGASVELRIKHAYYLSRAGKTSQALHRYCEVAVEMRESGRMPDSLRRTIIQLANATEGDLSASRRFSQLYELYPVLDFLGVQQVLCLESEKKPAEAWEACESLLKNHPESFEALYLALRLSEERKDDDLQEKLLLKACKFDPRNVNNYEKLGELWMRRNNKAKALMVWSNIVEINPQDPETHLKMSDIFEKQGMYDEALSSVSRAIELRPEQKNGYGRLLALLSKAGDVERLEKNYEGLLKLESKGLADVRTAMMRALLRIYQKGMEKYKALGNNEKTEEYRRKLLKTLESENKDKCLEVIMFWDTSGNDVDLHIVNPDGEKCSYENLNTKAGGKLYEDVTDGFGPEIFVQQKHLAGEYNLKVHYFSGEVSTWVDVMVIVYNPDEEPVVMPIQRVTLEKTGVEKSLPLITVK